MNLIQMNYYSKLTEWREIMAAHGYQHRAEEIQEMLDDLCTDHVECVYNYSKYPHEEL